MALSSDIIALLDRTLDRFAARGPEPLAGDDLPARLSAIVAEIDATVLPRNLIYGLQDGLSCALTVASRRLMRISVSSPEGHQVIAAEPGADRAEQLLVLVEALAGLAAIEEPLMLTRHPLAEEMAAEEVGQAAEDIRAFCEEHNWFEPPPEPSDVPLGWCELDGEGTIMAAGGEPGFAPEALAALAIERASWPHDVGELAGPDGVLIVETASGRSVAFHLADGRTRLVVGEHMAAAGLMKAARGSGGSDT